MDILKVNFEDKPIPAKISYKEQNVVIIPYAVYSSYQNVIECSQERTQSQTADQLMILLRSGKENSHLTSLRQLNKATNSLIFCFKLI